MSGVKRIIQVHIYKGDKYFIAECADLPVVTQGKTLNELAENLKEAIDKARNFEHDVILITGSLYLVGEALELVSKKQIKELICLSKQH